MDFTTKHGQRFLGAIEQIAAGMTSTSEMLDKLNRNLELLLARTQSMEKKAPQEARISELSEPVQTLEEIATELGIPVRFEESGLTIVGPSSNGFIEQCVKFICTLLSYSWLSDELQVTRHLDHVRIIPETGERDLSNLKIGKSEKEQALAKTPAVLMAQGRTSAVSRMGPDMSDHCADQV